MGLLPLNVVCWRRSNPLRRRQQRGPQVKGRFYMNVIRQDLMQSKSVHECQRAWNDAVRSAERAFNEEVSTYVRKRLAGRCSSDLWNVGDFGGLHSVLNDLIHQTGVCFVDRYSETHEYQQVNAEESNTVNSLLERIEATESWFLRMTAALESETNKSDWLFRLFWERHALQIRLFIRDILQVVWNVESATNRKSAVRLIDKLQSAAYEAQLSWLSEFLCDAKLDRWFMASWPERRELLLQPERTDSDQFLDKVKETGESKLQSLVGSLVADAQYSPHVAKQEVRDLLGVSETTLKRMMKDGRLDVIEVTKKTFRVRYECVQGLKERIEESQKGRRNKQKK